MALFAAVQVRSGSKLLVVLIFMAIRACRELHFILRVFPCGRVAFIASDSCMFPVEWIFRRRMLFNAEYRRLPGVNRVALRAFAFAYAGLELPLMRVNRVAIRALCKRQLLFEITSRMAVDATHQQMPAGQWVFCFRMVKLHRRANLFPTRRCVTRLTSSLETSLVRIRVAITARLEFDAAVLHRFIRPRREVAFFTRHLGMHAGKRILRFRMIELFGLLPVRDVMAALAIIAELSLVNVLMATGALLGQAQERGGEIFILNQRT